jgi:methylenetetrahydrofolate--tRNA-(uracil-5-)-methyltransferase
MSEETKEGFDAGAPVLVAGGGLAGVEAALQLARRGVKVRLSEMKPGSYSKAHKSPDLAELVCSNSLKSMGLGQASGLLQEEMRLLGSAVIDAAFENRVAAGQALAVDRARFSRLLTEMVEKEPLIELVREEVSGIPRDRYSIIATGPLTSAPLAKSIEGITGSGELYFYDAMAPIIDGETIDEAVAFRASRYGKGGDDYLNCPMNKEEFDLFFDELLKAQKVPTKDCEEERVFSACQPIEVIAESGSKTLRFGPMKPVGLVDPRTGERPWAAVQLRREDAEGQRWSMVGFQTKLVYGEQERVFRLIPGLEKAQFYRLGSLHRNTYVDGPKVLDGYLRLRKAPWVSLAGQITGVEGYLESAAMGIWAGLNLALRLTGRTPPIPPVETALGALINHVTHSPGKKFEPMNMNFGILPPLGTRMRDKEESKRLRSERALGGLENWMKAL